MTITFAAVYAPIGFLAGLTGSLFREFAFTLAGAVIISGVMALTLVADDVLADPASRTARRDGSRTWSTATFTRVANAYGRRLDRTLDYRPVTALFAVAVLGITAFLFIHTSAELAPEEDQGIVFSPDQGAAICQPRLRRRLRRAARPGFRLVPRDRHAVHRQRDGGRPQQRHRRHDPQAVGRARARRQGAQSAGPGQAQRDHRRAGVRVLAAAAAGLDRRPAGADGDQLARRLRDRVRADGADQGGGPHRAACSSSPTAISPSTIR